MNRRGRNLFAVAFVTAAAVGAGPAASNASATSDRTAVFIASGAGTDPALGDNLNEVAIAKLAERSPGERVGTHELRRWMAKTGGDGPVPACISRTPCLRRLGAELGVRKIISGSVLADGGEFTIALTLLDAESGGVEATSTKTVAGDLEQVIRAVQDAVLELVNPNGNAPRLTLARDPAAPPTASRVVVITEQSGGAAHGRTERRRWPVYVGLGAAAASVLSLSAAAIFGVMAGEDPMGVTRAEMQRDVAKLDDYATAANTLWIVGGTLGATAIGMLLWHRAQPDGR